MLNVGLVGFGFAGKTFHAPVIRVVEGLCLTTIVQRHGGGAPDPRYAAVEFVSSVDELLARSVDLVVIATPNTSHHPIAKQCLLAGRHVVIDKPFTTTVAEADELTRVVPVVARLAAEAGVPVSIDTRKAAVASAALQSGATIVNDVTAGRDPDMLHAVAAAGAGIVLMHMQGDPQSMQNAPAYGDVVVEVGDFLAERVMRACDAGLDQSALCCRDTTVNNPSTITTAARRTMKSRWAVAMRQSPAPNKAKIAAAA